MGKRRVFFLVAIVLGAAVYATTLREPGRDPNPVPFATLEQTLEPEIQLGWSVTIPPKRQGPYRRIPGTLPVSSSLYRIRDRDGTTEEILLESSPKEQQMILELDTADGHRTLVALKRPRE